MIFFIFHKSYLNGTHGEDKCKAFLTNTDNLESPLSALLKELLRNPMVEVGQAVSSEDQISSCHREFYFSGKGAYYKNQYYYFIPWFFIYENFDELYGAVLTSIKSDVFSNDVFSKAECDGQYYERRLKKIMLHYAHPQSGNLFNVRELTSKEEIINAWATWFCKANGLENNDINKVRFTKIATNMAEKINRETATVSFKSKEFTYGSMKDLARALHSIVVATPFSKLSKIFALELCLNEKLLADQKKMISKWRNHDNNKNWIKDTNSKQYERYMKGGQYYKYYESNKSIKGFDSNFLQLINSFVNPEDKSLPPLPSIPPIIIGAIIINDIRNIAGNHNTKYIATGRNTIEQYNGFDLCNTKDFSHSRPRSFSDPKVQETTDAFSLEVQSNSNAYGRFVSGHGPSGHMSGILDFWKNYAHDGVDTNLVAACSMHALWSLYYDRRVSPVHTLIEVFAPLGNKTINSERHLYVDKYTLEQATTYHPYNIMDSLIAQKSDKTIIANNAIHEGLKVEIKSLIQAISRKYQFFHWGKMEISQNH